MASAFWTSAVSVAAYYVSAQLDDKDPAVVWLLRAAWAVVAAADLCALLYVRRAILRKPDHSILTYFPPSALRRRGSTRPREPEPEEAVITTHSRYDLGVWWRMLATHLIGAATTAAAHAYLGMLSPLCIGAAAGPMHLLDAPLVRVHLLGAKPEGPLARPFGAPESVWGSVAAQWRELRAELGGGGVAATGAAQQQLANGTAPLATAGPARGSAKRRR
jgi:hypothetical protein